MLVAQRNMERRTEINERWRPHLHAAEGLVRQCPATRRSSVNSWGFLRFTANLCTALRTWPCSLGGSIEGTSTVPYCKAAIDINRHKAF